MSNELTTLLLPRTATLVYAVPLLIVSLVLTFAGTFLALDRTRSFPPKHDKSEKFIYSSYESFEKRRKRSCFWWWRLEGGVGGLAIGFAFGMHLATLLALMVANISTSAPLSSTAFVAVCIISAILSSLVAGRYRTAAVLFASLSSGALTSMALSVMLHPPLTGRRILLVVLTILIAVPTTFIGIVSQHISAAQSKTCLAYLPHLAHPFLRFCTASSGSFSLILSIALLLNPPATSWANVWERLWVSDGEGWQTSQEKGLTAAWVSFTCLGILEDWALRKWLGEDPDEKWDDYMSAYVRSLPFSSDRVGTFKPLHSLWDRLFRRRTHSDPAFLDSSKHDPSSKNIDLKLKSLLKDDVSSPLLNSAVPDLFYADTPPPSHLPPHKFQYKSKQDNANLRPGTEPSDPLSDSGEACYSDGSGDYDLPPFVRERRKKGRFAKLRLHLLNSDSFKSNSAGFKPLAPAGKNDSQGKVGETRLSFLDDEISTTVCSTILISSGVKQTPTPGSDAGTSEGGRFHSQETGMIGGGRTEPRASTADYSDYEVDLTSMAPSPQDQRKGRELVPKFVDQPVSLSTSHTQSQTSNSEASSSTEAKPSSPGPSATDRARAKVRAIVAGSSNRPSRRGSLAQMPRIPISPPPVFRGSQSSSPDMGSLSPTAWPASVPATPSLVNDLHRVAAAQQQAYGVHTAADNHGLKGLPMPSSGDADSRRGSLPEIAADRGGRNRFGLVLVQGK